VLLAHQIVQIISLLLTDLQPIEDLLQKTQVALGFLRHYNLFLQIQLIQLLAFGCQFLLHLLLTT